MFQRNLLPAFSGSALVMEAENPSETLIHIYQSTRLNGITSQKTVVFKHGIGFAFVLFFVCACIQSCVIC
jgi:hypothetical protein